MTGKDAVTRIKDDPEHQDAGEEIEAIDIDLDDLDESLRREHVGKPIKVKVGGVVVSIIHVNDWSSSAMTALNTADWQNWAAAVIEDQDELEAFLKADLRNYQMEAIAREVMRQARMNRGKSRRRAGSSNGGRKR